MRMRISIGLLGLLIVAGNLLSAQDCSLTVTGRLTDAETGHPLAYANVLIAGTTQGTQTELHGIFRLEGVCPDSLTLVCSYVGYETLRYPFRLEGDTSLQLHLHPESFQLSDVVVTTDWEAPELLQARDVLDREALASTQGFSLGESLSQLPGVTTLNTGATIAKPVIQGLHSNRVLILNNGVRQESQQWGSEHAPEIDPFLANQVTVIKGASSVRYGSDAIGGVILVEPPALPESPGLGGELNLQGFSNGAVGILSGMLEGKLKGKLPLSARMQGTVKKGGNLRTPDYFLRNTGVEEVNGSWTLGLKDENYQLEAFHSIFFTKLGILRDAHIGNLTDLRNAIERGRPLEDGSFSYFIGRPVQRIVHHLTKVSGSLRTGERGRLHLLFARQFNRRQEFDAHRPFGELSDELVDPDIEFEITTYTTDLYWTHQPIANFSGEIGGQLLYQRNTTDRGALIPNFRNTNASAWWIERWKKPFVPFEWELGLRYDARWMDVDVDTSEVSKRDLRFQNLSATLGALYRFSELFTAKLSFSTAWRAPHVSELYSDGVHHGSASYEKGNPLLDAERAYNTALTLELNNEKNFSASAQLYYNRIRDFIYLNPRELPVLTIRGAFPAFDYQQADVRIMGLDGNLRWEFAPGWQFEERLSLLRGFNRSLQDHLIFMPPDQFEHSLSYRFRWKGRRDEGSPAIRLSMINVLEQRRVPPDVDYTDPPPGNTRFNLEGSMRLNMGKQPIELGVSVFNLFNVRYRQYLNRFRYFVDENGTNVSVRLRLPFGANRS